ncbi:hypothetical protein M0802_007361 [Mischocyttarus mexicanus]|nr:hypothetical protein M0802_007361 [Mischocyttarus mexicanus]
MRYNHHLAPQSSEKIGRVMDAHPFGFVGVRKLILLQGTIGDPVALLFSRRTVDPSKRFDDNGRRKKGREEQKRLGARSPLVLQLRYTRTISLNFITRNFRHPVVLVIPPLGTDEMGSFHITHIMYPSLS